MDQTKVKLYGSYLCSSTRAIHSFFNYTEIPYEYVIQDFPTLKSPEYLKINPKGQVPAIIDGEFNLSESTTILRYLSKTRPQSKAGPLYSQDNKKCARIDELLDWFHCSLRKNAKQILYNLVFADMLGKPKESESALAGYWDNLEKDLDLIDGFHLKDHQYIANNELSIADFIFATEIIALSCVNYDFDKHPAIKKWLQSILQIPGFFEANEQFFKELGSKNKKNLYELTKKMEYFEK